MGIRIEGHFDFSGLAAHLEAAIPAALEAGGTVIKDDAVDKVPKESGHLAGTAAVDMERGGDNTVGITFDGPYAAYQHEDLSLKHVHGGQAKYLEMAMVEKGDDALDEAARVIREAL